jgi:hypothetical protein
MVDRKNLERRPILDPAVADLLTGLEHKQSLAHLPRREREKKTREHEKILSRREQRVTYDLPPWLRQRIKEIAEMEGIPASQLVTLAMLRFLDELGRGEVDLAMFKTPSRSPRYDWNLTLPEEGLHARRRTR